MSADGPGKDARHARTKIVIGVAQAPLVGARRFATPKQPSRARAYGRGPPPGTAPSSKKKRRAARLAVFSGSMPNADRIRTTS
jgi:hypothetical protein